MGAVGVVSLLGLILGMVGVLPTLAIVFNRVRNVLPVRRALGLSSKFGTDILVTTSYTGISSVGPAEGPRAKRDLMPSGDLAGVAEICALLSRAYAGRPYVITASRRKQDDARRDQILVGGPVHNQYTSQLVCGSRTKSSPDTVVVFDADERYIRLGAKEWGPRLDLRFKDDLPQVEYAIVLLTEITRFGGNQRVIAIGGLTTYGTHAAAHFLVHGLVPYLRSKRLGPRPNVCVLIRAAIVNAQPYDVQAVDYVAMPRTGPWHE